MGEGNEVRAEGRIGGLLGSIFGRKKQSAHQALSARSLEELNSIKEKVQSSPPVQEEKTQAPLAFTEGGNAQAPNTLPGVQPASVPDPPARPRLDDVRRSIEASARRRTPAHVKKHVEELNAHLRYIRRKSSLNGKKLEKLVDEKVKQELAHAQPKEGSAPAQPEPLEKFQKQLLGLVDVSDRKSQLGMEQIQSQMEGLRRQINNIPAILTQKEADELSPLKEEVAVLRGELRKALPNVSDAGERAKLEATIARVEGIAKAFERSPQQETVQSELEALRAQLNSISGSLEKNRLSEEEFKKQEEIERESLRQGLSGLKQTLAALSSQETASGKELRENLGIRLKELESKVDAKSLFELSSIREEMDGLKKSIQSVPSTIEDSEVHRLESLKRSLSDVRTSVQQVAEDKQKLEGVTTQIEGLRRQMEALSRKVGSVLPEDFGSLRDELRTMRSSIKSILSSARSREETELTASLQKELNSILGKLEERSSAEFGRLERNLTDVRNKVSDKLEESKPEIKAVRYELESLKASVDRALAQPKNEDEKKLLINLQSRLEQLLQVSDSRNVAEFSRLESELADVRNSVSRVPGVVGAREKPELDAIRGEVLGLQRLVSDALAQPKNDEEKKLLVSLQSRLEELSHASEARNASEFGRLEELSHASEARNSAEFNRLESELADVRNNVSRIPSIVGAREKPELDGIKGEIVSLKKAVSEALERPLDEYEKNLLSGLQSRLEGLLNVSESHNVAELGKLEGELADIRARISHIPTLVGARGKADNEYIQGEILGLKKLVSDALASPKDEVERKFLKGLESRLEDMFDVGESRSLKELGELRGELADVRRKVAGIPSRVEAGSKLELDAIKGNILSLQKAVSAALLKPRDEVERNFLKGLELRLEGLLRASDANSLQQMDGLRKEIEAVRNNVSTIPSRMESGERRELASLKDDVKVLRSTVEKALAQPKNLEEREMLEKVLAQLDGMVNFFDLRAGAAIDSIKSEVDSIAGQVAELHAGKGEAASIAKEVRTLGKSLSRGMVSSGVKERQILEQLSARLDALSSSLESKTGSAANGLKKELEGMRDQIIGVISAEQPEIESLQFAILSLRDLVEKAIEKEDNSGLEPMLNSLRSKIAEMLQLSEAKTDADYLLLRQMVEQMHQELEVIPAAQKPELASIKSSLESIQKAVNRGGKSSIGAIQGKLDDILSSAPRKGSVSELRAGIASIQRLLETRIRKTKEGGKKSALKRKASKLRKGISRSHGPSKLHPAPRRSSKAAHSPKHSASTLRHAKRSASIKLLRMSKRRPSSRLKKMVRARSRRELKKVVSSLQREMKSRKLSPRGRSDIESFISQLERKNRPSPAKTPAIERRLGGKFSSNPKAKSMSRQLRELEDTISDEPHSSSPGLDRPSERRAEAGDASRLTGLHSREGSSLAESHDHLHVREDAPAPVELHEYDDTPSLGGRPHEPAAERTDKQSHVYESYLQDEKIGRIGTDVKRMHQRLKDIKKLYEEEL